jgi:leader peptidase (prepilin peptidase)/N-methyltransferase
MEGYLIARIVEVAAVAILGAIMGSFLYVVALNVSRLETIIKRRSGCPHCDHQLRWFELLPLISYIIQRGRCRACGRRLTPAYFWSEVGVAVLFASLYWLAAPLSPWAFGALLLAVSGWFVLLVDDWRTLTIDVGFFFRLTWVISIVAVLVEAGSHGWLGGMSAVWGALLGGGILLLIRIVGSAVMKREAMGDGDPPVGALVGLLVGGFAGVGSVALCLLLSFIIGSIIGLVPMIWRRRFDSMKEVPFTPALFLAGWIALLWGPQIVNWYLWLL